HPVSLVERGQLADGPFDVIGFAPIRVVEERDVGLDGRSRRGREVGLVKCPQDGLGPDNEDVPIACDRARGPKQVGELVTCHAATCPRSQYSRNDRSTCRRTGSGSTPANGLFCRNSRERSSVPVSTAATSSTPPSMSCSHCRR